MENIIRVKDIKEIENTDLPDNAVIIQLDNDYKHIKKEFRKKIPEAVKSNLPIILVENDSTYTSEFEKCIHALSIKDKKERITYIYENVCDYLDSQFSNCNLCQFKDNKCLANREIHNFDSMGCCHLFDSYSIFSISIRPKEYDVCPYLKNKSCSTQNISCKLFTCRYLRKKGIYFNYRKMLLLTLFLTEKQLDIARFNYFRTKEEIINKLLKKDYSPYIWWLFIRGYKIR